MRRSRIEHQLSNAGSFFKSRAGERHLHDQHVVRVETRIDGAQHAKRANHQSRADQENNGQSHLHDDQKGARFVVAQSRPGARTAFFQRGSQVGARSVECRNEAEQYASEERNDQSENQYAPVEHRARSHARQYAEYFQD